MVTFQLATVESYDKRSKEILVVWYEGDKNNRVRRTQVLKPGNFRHVHLALRGEIAFKLNCGRQIPAPTIPEKDAKAVFGMTGDTWYWTFAEEYNVLAKKPIYQIVKKTNILWEGRELDLTAIARVYNPRASQNKGKGAYWQKSTDNGKTYRRCSCPKVIEKSFDDEGDIRIAA